MRRIESIEDQINGVVTYELGDGRRVRLDSRAVQQFGARALMAGAGVDLPPAVPLRVYQGGNAVGWLPADFDPMLAQSGSFLYDFRPGDFHLDGDGWEASPALGTGDLEAAGVRPTP